MMGLAERRILKDFIEHHLPGLQEQINAAAGFEVPLEINWDQLTKNGHAHAWADDWSQLYFQPLVAALNHITQDDLGRDALKATLKQIVLKDESGIYSSDTWSQFQNGVLTLDHEPTNLHHGDDRTNNLIRTLERNL